MQCKGDGGLTELQFDGGEALRGDRPAWVVLLRRPLLLLVVTVLGGAAYLAGIWTGVDTHATCVTTGPGLIVCGRDKSEPPTQAPPA